MVHVLSAGYASKESIRSCVVARQCATITAASTFIQRVYPLLPNRLPVVIIQLEVRAVLKTSLIPSLHLVILYTHNLLVSHPFVYRNHSVSRLSGPEREDGGFASRDMLRSRWMIELLTCLMQVSSQSFGVIH